MCGICGFVGNYSRDLLEKMTDIMSHRGPDDRGFYKDDDVGLGHRRLSIIDLQSGHQPIFNENDSIVLIYNGETYNFSTLREDLLKKGHQFKTRTDSEVIVHLYEEHGERCVDYLRGMFAFAIWDKKKKELFLARDRFGIKPLYFTETSSGIFIFASEIKSILQIPDVKREIDPIAVDQYFTFRYVPENRTMFKNIYKLEPGHILIRKNNNNEIKQYWDISFDNKPFFEKNENEVAQQLTELLQESIKLRLISDVPLGAYLSGGLDSSFMVALMSRICSEPLETFSIGFDDEKWDESLYSDLIAEEFHTNHHKLRAESKAIELIEKVIWHLDEPMADAATIPTYMMSKLTREYVTVVLSGEGADEIFAGYDKYKVLTSGNAIKSVVFSPFFNLLSQIPYRNIKATRLCEYLGNVHDIARAYIRLQSVFSEKEKSFLYSDEYKKTLGNVNSSVEIIQKYITKFDDVLNNLLYVDIKTWLPNDVLLKNDKMTMANSIEARVPFLDHVFAEYCAHIPVKMKLKGLTDKYILRKAMQSVVPDTIIKRKKHGFTVPIQKWMAGSLLDYCKKVLSRENIERRGYLNYSFIEPLLNRDLDNIYYRRQFWSVLTFELWCQIFLDRQYPAL